MPSNSSQRLELASVGTVMQCDTAGSGLAGAVLVSNPCCLNSAMVALERPWRLGLLYNLILAGRLRQVGQALPCSPPHQQSDLYKKASLRNCHG